MKRSVCADYVNKLIVENGLQSAKITRAFVDLNEIPITINSNPINNEDIKLTDGFYYVKYNPSNSVTGKKYSKQFIVFCDMFKNGASSRFFGWEDFYKQACNDKVVRWLKRNTNISAGTFDIARKNINLKIPFCVDFPTYCAKIGQDILRPYGIAYLAKKQEERNNK